MNYTFKSRDEAVGEKAPLLHLSTGGTGGDLPAEVAIFRPFFFAGILSVLTTGCLLGAVALWGIALRQSYTSTGWTPLILAHANSQLFGWVGLFVMGFALQQHPPRKSRIKLFYGLGYASLVLILVGIALRFAAEPLVGSGDDVWRPLGVLSAVFQSLAVLLFVLNTGLTRARSVAADSGKVEGLPWQSWFVFASLGWWIIVAAAEPIVFSLTHQADRLANILFVAKWFVPYRDAQFLGFVVNMIFGVGLARFPDLFGTAPPIRRLGLAGFAVWNVGLLARMAGWLSYFDSEMAPGSNRLYVAGGLALALGAVILVAASRCFEAATPVVGTPTIARKFLRAAMSWLLIAGGMVLLEPAHLSAIGHPFSHAYIGAIRHAVTVGFISQMIVGVSMQVVPRLRGSAPFPAGAAWIVFALLNMGNGLRVICEVVTDYTPGAFGLMGVTGFVELIALLVWGVYLGSSLLLGRKGPERIHPAAESA